MDDVGRWLFFVVFLILSFFFSAAEATLLSMNEGKMRELTDKNASREKIAKKLFDGPIKKKIIWMDLTHTLCLGAAIVLGTLLLYREVHKADFYAALVQPGSTAAIAAIIITAILAFLITAVVAMTFGNLLPKKLFANQAEAFLLRFYSFVRGISYLFRPFVVLTAKLANGLAALFGVKNTSFSDQITEEEIRSMVDAGEENGAIHQEEREMINNIFDFDDCMASDLMTHRTDVVAVELGEKISDVVYYAINEGFSRIPVYEGDIDNIKGVIYVKDLLCLVGCKSAEDFKISDFIRETIYVPEAKRCLDLFHLFKTKKVHMAVVVDEYGGTAGIITLEDMLESIVGNIQDEYDDEQEEITKLSEDEYLFDGAVDLEDVAELFAVEFEEDEDTDTLGGLIVETLGRIPEENETPSVTVQGIRFTVIVVEDHRIVKVKAERLPSEPGNPEQGETKE